MYKAKCGHEDHKENNIEFAKITCQLVGCKNCKHFNGMVYYERDIAKGVSQWVRTKIKNKEV